MCQYVSVCLHLLQHQHCALLEPTLWQARSQAEKASKSCYITIEVRQASSFCASLMVSAALLRGESKLLRDAETTTRNSYVILQYLSLEQEQTQPQELSPLFSITSLYSRRSCLSFSHPSFPFSPRYRFCTLYYHELNGLLHNTNISH